MCCVALPVLAQQPPAASEPVQEVVITGSRIKQSVAQSTQPLSVISSADIERTGLASVGDLIQQLTTGGSALNAKFNSSGNFGYPPDGGGIGAGSSQVDLRNLDSKRTLVMVDGLRWVNESSASGVSGSADLNTIPLSIIDHIEVLEDGASSIYGSDAIAGVVNIITRKRVQGVEVSGYTGDFSKGGRTTVASMTAGGSSGKFSGLFVASFYNQNDISSSKWAQSSFPEPNAGISAGSSAVPQGRDQFCDPSVPAGNLGTCAKGGTFYNVTLNTGTTTPFWNPNNPTTPPSSYHAFSNADRFNYAPFNLLLTPSQRKALWTGLTYDATPTSTSMRRACSTPAPRPTRRPLNRSSRGPLPVPAASPTESMCRLPIRSTRSVSICARPHSPLPLRRARGGPPTCPTSASLPAVRSKPDRAFSTRMSTPGTSAAG
jgi:iron complex outermembrane receptor protein